MGVGVKGLMNERVNDLMERDLNVDYARRATVAFSSMPFQSLLYTGPCSFWFSRWDFCRPLFDAFDYVQDATCNVLDMGRRPPPCGGLSSGLSVEDVVFDERVGGEVLVGFRGGFQGD